jgi:quinol monooxygenase YgiN
MLIVTGALRARPETFEALKAACVAHSQRSRTEPGCLSHNVHTDAEDPLRLFFFELWVDRAALDAHFADAHANAFMTTARALSEKTEGPDILEAELPQDAA